MVDGRRIFKTRYFDRFARKQKIGDDALIEAVDRVDRGLIDADLGGGLVKQRIARQGRGRSSGYRVIIACKVEKLAFFLFGFAKNEKSDLAPQELTQLREVANLLLEMLPKEIEAVVDEGEIMEIRA